MCIAIYTKAGAVISEQAITASFNSNRDGAGLAYVDDEGKLQVLKTDKLDVFQKMYKECCQRFPESHKMLHFRVSTSGGVNAFNTHPFYVDNNTVMCHNGVITKCNPKKDDKRNDTQIFNDTILKNISRKMYKNPAIKELIEEYIGFSKVIVMNNRNDFVIFNEDKGHWDKEGQVWYSNYSYITYADRRTGTETFFRGTTGTGTKGKDGYRETLYGKELQDWLESKFYRNADGALLAFNNGTKYRKNVTLGIWVECDYVTNEFKEDKQLYLPATTSPVYEFCELCDIHCDERELYMVRCNRTIHKFIVKDIPSMVCKDCLRTAQNLAQSFQTVLEIIITPEKGIH